VRQYLRDFLATYWVEILRDANCQVAMLHMSFLPKFAHRRDAQDSGNGGQPGNEARQRDQRESVALEHVGEALNPVIDRMAREPRYPPGTRTDSIEGKIAPHDATVDAQQHQAGRHEIVHHDVAAKHDGDVRVGERKRKQGEELEELGERGEIDARDMAGKLRHDPTLDAAAVFGWRFNVSCGAM